MRRLVDVGGGHGHLVSTIMQRYPGLSAVVFDQPHVVAGAEAVLTEAEFAALFESAGLRHSETRTISSPTSVIVAIPVSG